MWSGVHTPYLIPYFINPSDKYTTIFIVMQLFFNKNDYIFRHLLYFIYNMSVKT